VTAPIVTPTTAALQQHAHDLARAFKARIIESAQLQPHEAFAAAHIRAAFVSTIVDTTTYAVALHELGHLAAPTGALRTANLDAQQAQNLSRVEEDAAWTWARHYALIWTPEMDAVANWAEGTYQAPAATPASPTPTPTPKPAAPTDHINWNKYR
jgi:hypothetical protein